MRANNLLQFIHQVTIEFRFRKSLAQAFLCETVILGTNFPTFHCFYPFEIIPYSYKPMGKI